MRVGVYIDGFNLFYSLRRMSWKKYYWYSPYVLSSSFLSAGETLSLAKYFTARITLDADKQKRQTTYLEAVQETAPQLELFYGRYKNEPFDCSRCKHTNLLAKEKMTDVNIAVQMLNDAYEDRWDKVILVSSDSDLVPPLKAIQAVFPLKKRTIAFPPGQFAVELKKSVNYAFTIGEHKLSASLMPDPILKAPLPGQTIRYELRKPDRWK